MFCESQNVLKIMIKIPETRYWNRYFMSSKQIDKNRSYLSGVLNTYFTVMETFKSKIVGKGNSPKISLWTI